VIEESLLIFGWVANWRPIEIFLSDWWRSFGVATSSGFRRREWS
jgi:hypothetical protein